MYSGSADCGRFPDTVSGEAFWTNIAACLQSFQQGGVCGKAGDHRHQVRLTGAVVTDDQQALVVDRLVELHLRNDKLDEPFGHFLARAPGLGGDMLGTKPETPPLLRAVAARGSASVLRPVLDSQRTARAAVSGP